jgi:vacuolar-type H+-ATPase subunit I/STV1
LERELAAVTKERDALRVHCTIADQTLDEMYGLTTRLGEAIASIDVLKDERDEWQAEADGIGEQLNKLSKQYAFALDERDAALTRIKRLEEAGEWMASARNEDDFNAAVKAWTQAKEAR